MAFPWAAINSVNLANGNIVEDLKLGLDLAIAGYPPVYCASARVTSQQPQNQRTATTQRTRWEHGHLQTLLEYGPTLVLAALQQRRADLLSLALELCVPPLSLLVLLWSSLTAALTATALFSGFWLAAGLSYLAGGLLLSAIWMAWYGFARQEVSLRQLLSVPLYILWKIPLYLKFLTKPESQWIRTERGD
jgi:cellulose synthase/poly-beta-1,6-N-acetylglucosamine synthase-like glycosyltransferase